MAMTDEASAGEGKKLQIVWRERFRETERLVERPTGRLREEGASNTEWLELGLRAALMADATEILEALLNSRISWWLTMRSAPVKMCGSVPQRGPDSFRNDQLFRDSDSASYLKTISSA